jgi:hypothetical protein
MKFHAFVEMLAPGLFLLKLALSLEDDHPAGVPRQDP